MKSLCEQRGVTYRQEDDYLTPNLLTPEGSDTPPGKYGRFQCTFLKEHHREEHLKNELKMQTTEQQGLIDRLAHEFAIAPMERPYEYAKNLQDNRELRQRQLNCFQRMGMKRLRLNK